MNSSQQLRRLRLFCASPGDVAEERQRVHDIVASLNRSGQFAARHGLFIEVLDWQTHVSPQMGRPEGVTLEQLQPADWDIFVGVLWLRFGSATGKDESGTHEEFREAYALWQKSERPKIWFYQCKRLPEDLDDIDPEQHKRVKDFFTQCQHDGKHPGFYRVYQTPEDFSHKLRDDLEKFILSYSKEEVHLEPAPEGATTNVASNATTHAATKQVEQHRRRYLDKLHTECNRLPLAALAEDRERHAHARLTLNKVYIGLNTEDRVDEHGKLVTHESRELSREEQEKIRPLTALEAASRFDPLVILGEPGSGKSSFLHYLLAALAAKQLEPQSALQIAWPHAELFPVRVIMRKLAAFLQKEKAVALLDKSPEACERELCRLVYQYLAEALRECEAEDFSEALRALIEARRCLLVFDGLDETPPSERALLTRTVQTFCKHTSGNRFLLTCRNRSYEGDTILPGYKTVKLAAFDDEQVQNFAARWYEALVQLEQFTPARGEEKRDDLLAATQHLPETMVRNPLLLTTIANIHSNNVELPRQRVKLYQKASELLLKRWQEEKAGKLGLFEELGLKDDSKVYHALWEMGYYAQRAERGQKTADIPETEALVILRRNFAGVPNPWAAAEKLLAYVDETAGLLLGHGGAGEKIYGFPHRTFQEYFAGCYLAKRSRDFKRELHGLLAEGDYWRLAAQLGLEEKLHNDRDEFFAMDAAYALCLENEPRLEDPAAWRGVLWAAHFALEIGIDLIAQDKAPNGGHAFLARLQKRLATMLVKGLLPAHERIEAGFVLGKLGLHSPLEGRAGEAVKNANDVVAAKHTPLNPPSRGDSHYSPLEGGQGGVVLKISFGDPRPGVCSFPLEWVPLPGGRFIMGDKEDGPPHEVELAPFKMSKYPITNSQFAVFLAAGGYKEKQWWSEEGWKARQKEKLEQPGLWNVERFHLPNQPVVGVSWFEAEAFCNWLSEQGAEGEGQKARVRLPTEAEWEYAARGKAGRIFSWGEAEPSAELANYEYNVGRTTAVGSYPLGATPEGICDLTGNVWEWCRDWYDRGYYKTCVQHGVATNPLGPAKGATRVLRGGSWYVSPNLLRCAYRSYDEPTDRGSDIGFRCSLDVR